jgi:dCMP deaminase
MMRLSWDEYFMEFAHVAAKRSTCLRRQVGAVIVRENRILATGYNGAPKGVAHCLDTGCRREELQIPSGQRHELCSAVHAEQNGIIQAAVHGVSIAGATMYTTIQPCVLCAKMIINAEIKRVVCEGDYPDILAVSFLTDAGVELVSFPDRSDT